MEFQHRVALVTGGTGALGSSVALDLLNSGARVAVTHRSDKEWAALEARAGEHRSNLTGAQVDLEQPEDVERLVASLLTNWQRIDYLVAVAGGFAAGKSFETNDETWDHMLKLNLGSLISCLRSIVPVMIRQNFGRIVTVSSGSILRGGGAGIAAYAVSKGAVLQLSEILADELKAYDIHVHCILPGTMDTEANRLAMPKADFSKWVRTEEVARVVRFLLGDDAQPVRSVVVPVLGST
ncbi:MAG: SDR family NAD(P)-dependent oxidoreductase [Terriglobia bacterium]|jgi:NAD(P)-dependent dehydrogenase (short-subunit alcohol dehydrogenase family)